MARSRPKKRVINKKNKKKSENLPQVDFSINLDKPEFLGKVGNYLNRAMGEIDETNIKISEEIDRLRAGLSLDPKDARGDEALLNTMLNDPSSSLMKDIISNLQELKKNKVELELIRKDMEDLNSQINADGIKTPETISTEASRLRTAFMSVVSKVDTIVTHNDGKTIRKKINNYSKQKAESEENRGSDRNNENGQRGYESDREKSEQEEILNEENELLNQTKVGRFARMMKVFRSKPGLPEHPLNKSYEQNIEVLKTALVFIEKYKTMASRDTDTMVAKTKEAKDICIKIMNNLYAYQTLLTHSLNDPNLNINQDITQKRLNEVNDEMKNARLRFNFIHDSKIATYTYSVIINANNNLDRSIEDFFNKPRGDIDNQPTPFAENVEKAKNEYLSENGLSASIGQDVPVHKGSIKTSDSFDGIRNARVNIFIADIPAKGQIPAQTAQFATVQRIQNGSFVSRFRYTPGEIQALSADQRFILAVKEAENFIAAMPDPGEPIKISGKNLPKDFVMHMVNHISCTRQYENIATTHYASERDQNNHRRKLQKHLNDIYPNKDTERLAMSPKIFEEMRAKTKTTKEDLRGNAIKIPSHRWEAEESRETNPVHRTVNRHSTFSPQTQTIDLPSDSENENDSHLHDKRLTKFKKS
ncbi:MAG: hypothetical protein H0W64_03640 [Gammaproteobacteria bacterium]|nr:hypothetical protein [Gammaproteobacteria bacterium]